jgi:hypothetical protein
MFSGIGVGVVEDRKHALEDAEDERIKFNNSPEPPTWRRIGSCCYDLLDISLIV